MKNIKIIFLVLATVICACSKDSEPNELGEPIGSISAEEFNAVPAPTYQDFIDAYAKVVIARPELLKNKDELARAVFDEIAVNGTKTSKGEKFFNLTSSMNKAEWRIVLTRPLEAFSAIPLIETSFKSAIASFSCDEDVSFVGAKADALKHAFWSALMTKKTTEEFSSKFSTARENDTADETLKAMNLYNNAFGSDLILAFPEATEEQLLVLLVEQKYELVTSKEAIDKATETLVFLNGSSDFDLTMEGSFGNPDSGGPWDMTIVFSQCDEIIRGRFTIVRDESLQERRFSGVLSGDTMILDVSEPFIFENPTGLRACVDIVMTLVGDTERLSGSWVSTNCRLGGDVELYSL